MTPDEHYSVGLQYLATAESASAPTDLVHPNCVIAQTHFQAAVSGTAIRMAKQVTTEGIAVLVSPELIADLSEWSSSVQIKIVRSESSPTGYEMTVRTVPTDDPPRA